MVNLFGYIDNGEGYRRIFQDLLVISLKRHNGEHLCALNSVSGNFERSFVNLGMSSG